jgi:hypothetical protein
MKYDWITIAIENGGVLTTSKNVHGIASTMHWKGQEPICGERHTTLPDALTSLNAALEDDAAEEVYLSNESSAGTAPEGEAGHHSRP